MLFSVNTADLLLLACATGKFVGNCVFIVAVCHSEPMLLKDIGLALVLVCSRDQRLQPERT